MFWALLITFLLVQRKKMDFTLRIYRKLLTTLQHSGYRFVTFEQYCESLPEDRKEEPFVILRHDVDLKAKNSLRTAQIEHELGIKASYYFRVVPQSNQPEIIRAITALGHEIGYHYEDMAIAQGDAEQAFAHFKKQLAYFRQFYPVRTICMHGAPTSKWDGRELWKHYDYRQEGIVGEPYFDVDFSQVFYLTDTGRCWDGYKVSVRDKIPQYQDQWTAKGWVYSTTQQLIRAIQKKQLPTRIMITTHPQRWTDNFLAWVKELVMQSIKNAIKRILYVK